MNERPNISRAVGQPPIETPLGGRGVIPDLRPARKSHTGRNLALGLGAAAVVGAGAFAAIKMSGNEGNNGNVEPTQPGGIVEPSSSPIPTPIEPGETIVIPTESPTVTPSESPVITPTPEPTKAPALKTTATLLETEPTKISVEEVEKDIEIAHENKNIKFPSPVAYDLKGPKLCTSASGVDNLNKFEVRAIICASQIKYYMAYYSKSGGDEPCYQVAEDFYNLAMTTLPDKYKPLFLRQLKPQGS